MSNNGNGNGDGNHSREQGLRVHPLANLGGLIALPASIWNGPTSCSARC